MLYEAIAPHSVTLNGKEVSVYPCTVSAMPYNTVWPGFQRPIDQTEQASFCCCTLTEQNQPLHFRVKTDRSFETAVIRPLSRNIRAEIDTEGQICFEIREPGSYTVEADGHHNALHLFVNPTEQNAPQVADANVRYFGPGIHHPGIIELHSNETLYIAEGAVVHSAVKAVDAENIRICGYGVLDNSEFDRATRPAVANPSCMNFWRCRNIKIEGIVLKDACCWTLTCYQCRNVIIDNVKAIGMWRYNSDGFDMVNCINVEIKNCFLRTFDDGIVLKGITPYDSMNNENIYVTGCVVWCDWGRALEIGAETCCHQYRNIIFENCDIIHNTHMAMDIQNSGYADIHDVIFENIRVEYETDSTEPIYQNDMNMPYRPKQEVYVPMLMFAEIHTYYRDKYKANFPEGVGTGVNHHIRFKNIFVTAEEGIAVPKSAFSGLTTDSRTYDIEIDGLYFNGRRIADREEAAILQGDFCGDVRLK